AGAERRPRLPAAAAGARRLAVRVPGPRSRALRPRPSDPDRARLLLPRTSRPPRRSGGGEDARRRAVHVRGHPESAARVLLRVADVLLPAARLRASPLPARGALRPLRHPPP